MVAPSTTPSSLSLVGRTIGRYRLEELVGSGAMGDVYRGRHIGLGNDVAIKIMRPSVASEPKFKERFYREAKAASVLVHPNTVRVTDFGEEADGLVYLTMEFLRGRDLLSILREDWPIRDERIVDILAQTLAAVSVAHQNGIVHRDLKPENIMIVPDEDEAGRDHVKVCDFGIAKLVDARAFKSAEDITTALTVGHALIGTPEYMSPEQARGEPLDGRSDLYAVGVILYQLMTRRLPFNAENAIGLAVKQIVEEPQPPSRIHSPVNPRLEAICMRALKKDPNDRFATAKEMRTELRAAMSAELDAGASARAIESAPTLSNGFPNRQSSQPDFRRSDDPEAFHPTEVPAASAPPPGRDLRRELGLSDAEGYEAERSNQGYGVKPHREGMTPPPPPLVHAMIAREAPVSLPVDSSRRVIAFVLLALVGAAGIALIVSTRKSASTTSTTQTPESASTTGMVQAPTTVLIASAAPLPTLPDEPPSTAPIRGGRPSTRPTTTTTTTTTAVVPSTIPSAGPPPPLPPQPLPTAPTAPPGPSPLPPAPTAEYKPTKASVTLQPMIAERVQKDVIERKMGELASRLNSCYREALIITGAPVGGTATINMSVDPSGKVVSVVTAPQQLPSFQRCVALLVVGLNVSSSAVDPAGGTAEQILKLNP